MVVGRWSLVVGRWSLVIGCWSVGRWLLVVGRWSLVVGRWSMVMVMVRNVWSHSLSLTKVRYRAARAAKNNIRKRQMLTFCQKFTNFKMKDGGQRPFVTFPKLWPFWWGMASLRLWKYHTLSHNTTAQLHTISRPLQRMHLQSASWAHLTPNKFEEEEEENRITFTLFSKTSLDVCLYSICKFIKQYFLPSASCAHLTTNKCEQEEEKTLITIYITVFMIMSIHLNKFSA